MEESEDLDLGSAEMLSPCHHLAGLTSSGTSLSLAGTAGQWDLDGDTFGVTEGRFQLSP